MRDFNQANWTNQSPEVEEVLMWTDWLGNPSQRMDRQQFNLPASFLGETLTEVRITDNGGYDFDGSLEQRIYVAGVTVQSIPEPAAYGAMTTMLAWETARRRTKKSRK